MKRQRQLGLSDNDLVGQARKRSFKPPVSSKIAQQTLNLMCPVPSKLPCRPSGLIRSSAGGDSRFKPATGPPSDMEGPDQTQLPLSQGKCEVSGDTRAPSSPRSRATASLSTPADCCDISSTLGECHMGVIPTGLKASPGRSSVHGSEGAAGAGHPLPVDDICSSVAAGSDAVLNSRLDHDQGPCSKAGSESDLEEVSPIELSVKLVQVPDLHWASPPDERNLDASASVRIARQSSAGSTVDGTAAISMALAVTTTVRRLPTVTHALRNPSDCTASRSTFEQLLGGFQVSRMMIPVTSSASTVTSLADSGLRRSLQGQLRPAVVIGAQARRVRASAANGSGRYDVLGGTMHGAGEPVLATSSLVQGLRLARRADPRRFWLPSRHTDQMINVNGGTAIGARHEDGSGFTRHDAETLTRDVLPEAVFEPSQSDAKSDASAPRGDTGGGGTGPAQGSHRLRCDFEVGTIGNEDNIPASQPWSALSMQFLADLFA